MATFENLPERLRALREEIFENPQTQEVELATSGRGDFHSSARMRRHPDGGWVLFALGWGGGESDYAIVYGTIENDTWAADVAAQVVGCSLEYGGGIIFSTEETPWEIAPCAMHGGPRRRAEAITPMFKERGMVAFRVFSEEEERRNGARRSFEKEKARAAQAARVAAAERRVAARRKAGK